MDSQSQSQVVVVDTASVSVATLTSDLIPLKEISSDDDATDDHHEQQHYQHDQSKAYGRTRLKQRQRRRRGPALVVIVSTVVALVTLVVMRSHVVGTTWAPQQPLILQGQQLLEGQQRHESVRQARRKLGSSNKFNRAMESHYFGEFSCEDMHKLRERHYYEYVENLQQQVNEEGGEEQEHNSNLLYYKLDNFECDFATTCNEGEGIFLPMVFCSSTSATTTTDNHHDNSTQPPESSTNGSWLSSDSFFNDTTNRKQFLIFITSIPLLLYLLVLFRVLGSTGEEFFSPALELYSLKLGLPERFAGVTLLALGNGAPDVASTVSAIINDKHHGYLMALGELTGAAMVSTTLIVGAVTYIAYTNNGNNDTDGIGAPGTGEGGVGVLCGGSLVRDVMVFIVTMILVYFSFEDGTISQVEIKSFVWLYVIYCAIVLASDLYHKLIVVPRIRSNIQKQKQQQHDVENDGSTNIKGEVVIANETTSLLLPDAPDFATDPAETTIAATNTNTITRPIAIFRRASTNSTTSDNSIDLPLPSRRSRPQPIFRRSSLDSATTSLQQQHQQRHHQTMNWSISDIIMEAMSNYDADSYEDEDVGDEYPIVAATPNTTGATTNGNQDAAVAAAMSNTIDNSSSHSTRSIRNRRVGAGSWGQKQRDGTEPLIVFHPHHGGVVNLKQRLQQLPPILSPRNEESSSALSSGVAAQGSSSESLEIPPENWYHAVVEGYHELARHLYKQLWIETLGSSQYNMAEKVLIFCELPFTLLRMLSTPVPCDGYYCRPLVAISVALSPVWIHHYCVKQFDVDIFSSSSGDGDSSSLSIWITAAILVIPLIVGLLVLRYAPCGTSPMKSTLVVVPLSFVGFVVSATWLDYIADTLVDLLSYFGIILHIPSTIIGITILAWGNSSQDMIANMTIAKKGLSTMAITASFAGPLFNILVGLGIGFTILSKQQLGSSDDDELGNISNNDNVGYHRSSHEAEFASIPVSLNNPLRVGFLFAILNGLLVIFMGIFVGKGTIPKYYGYIALAIYAAYAVATITV